MIRGRDQTEGEGKPYVPSLIALAGLGIIVAVTARMGFEYWAMRRADPEMAWINLGCELIAFGGLAAALYGWPRRWAWVATGVLIAAGMSVVCGWTAYLRIAEDEHERARAAAVQTDAYRMALEDLNTARTDVRGWATADPRPTCACPDTIAAWGATHAAEAERREAVLVERQRRLDELTPQLGFSVGAVVRSAGLEAGKFLGFTAFGGVWLYAWRRRRSHAHRESEGVAEPTPRESPPEPIQASLPAPRPARIASRPNSAIRGRGRSRLVAKRSADEFAEWDFVPDLE